MSSTLSDKAKRLIIGRSPDWIKKFDVNEYKNNIPMIEKLYEEKQFALTKCFELENEVQELNKNMQGMELDRQKLSIQLKENKNNSLIIFVLSLIAAILLGIGVNIITDKPYTWAGWLMVIFSVMLEISAFFFIKQKRD